jgi:hypothetical protein
MRGSATGASSSDASPVRHAAIASPESPPACSAQRIKIGLSAKLTTPRPIAA